MVSRHRHTGTQAKSDTAATASTMTTKNAVLLVHVGLVALYVVTFVGVTQHFVVHMIGSISSRGVENGAVEATSPSKCSRSPSSHGHCLSLDAGGDMDEIISKAKQVFVTMKMKSAGNSMKGFARRCMKERQVDDQFVPPTGGMNWPNLPELRFARLTSSFKLPSVIASHVYSDSTLIDIIKHSTRRSIVVYLHRDENERVLAAVRHILKKHVCSEIGGQGIFAIAKDIIHSRNGTECVLNEAGVAEVIRHQAAEIGAGLPVLSCNAYEAIADNGPDMYFMPFTQASKLQSLLAKHHCPNVTSIRTNTDQEKENDVFIRLENWNSTVHIDSWLDEKINLMEWLAGMRSNASCQGKTRIMEDTLSCCPDQIIKAHSFV